MYIPIFYCPSPCEVAPVLEGRPQKGCAFMEQEQSNRIAIDRCSYNPYVDIHELCHSCMSTYEADSKI